MSGYIPCAIHPMEIFASECPACLRLQLNEAHTALEIASPSMTHTFSGHVYEDGKPVEWVDGCGKCRVMKILSKTEKRKSVEQTDTENKVRDWNKEA